MENKMNKKKIIGYCSLLIFLITFTGGVVVDTTDDLFLVGWDRSLLYEEQTKLKKKKEYKEINSEEDARLEILNKKIKKLEGQINEESFNYPLSLLRILLFYTIPNTFLVAISIGVLARLLLHPSIIKAANLEIKGKTIQLKDEKIEIDSAELRIKKGEIQNIGNDTNQSKLDLKNQNLIIKDVSIKINEGKLEISDILLLPLLTRSLFACLLVYAGFYVLTGKEVNLYSGSGEQYSAGLGLIAVLSFLINYSNDFFNKVTLKFLDKVK